MKRSTALFILFLAFLIAFCLDSKGYSQTSAVTATVVDSEGQALANGIWTAVLTRPAGMSLGTPQRMDGVPLVQSFSGAFNSGGAMLSTNIPRTDKITPAGFTWTFNLCGQTSSGCRTYVTTLTAASTDLSAGFSSAIGLIRVAAPSLNDMTKVIVRAYRDSEITDPAAGTIYYNVISGGWRGFDGTAWSDIKGSTTLAQGYINVVTNCGADNGGIVDTSAAITACYNNNPTRNIFWPAGSYNMGSTSVTPSGFHQITTCENQLTTIKFSAGTPGFIFDNSKASKGELHNCTLQGSEGWSSGNITTYVMPSGWGGTSQADGIRVFADHVIIEGVTVGAFGRHGIFTTNNIWGGNADHWRYTNVTVSSVRGHGFYALGNDSQVGVCSNCDARATQGWGFLDEGNLGNTYIEGHTTQDGGDSTNPSSTVNILTTAQSGNTVTITTDAAHGASVNSWVKILGTTRVGGLNNWFRVTAVPDATTLKLQVYIQYNALSIITVAPGADTGTLGVTPGGEIWRLAGFDGGPYKNTGTVSAGVYIGCYSEFGQVPSKLSSGKVTVGGTLGAGFDYTLGPTIYGETAEGIKITPHRLDGTNYPVSLFMDFGRERAYTLQDGSPCYFRLVSGPDNFNHHLCMTANQQLAGWYGFRTDEQARTTADDNSAFYAQLWSDGTATNDPSRAWFPNGFLLGRIDTGMRRRVTVSTAQPATCLYTGEIALMTNPANTTLGWLCTATGTPGTWVRLITENNVNPASQGALRLSKGTSNGIYIRNQANTGDVIALSTGATSDIVYVGDTAGVGTNGPLSLIGITFATLGTPNNGTMNYCSDCTVANPCAGGGSGALAKRLGGVWVCN